MRAWKAAGRASREAEEDLWGRFKAAQDQFFAARAEALSEKEAELREHAVVKEGLLEVVWDDASSEFAYRDPRGGRALLELAPVPSWHELQFRG